MNNSELQQLIEDRIDFYIKEKQTPLSQYYRGVCSGNIEAYRSVLQLLKENTDV